MFIIYMWHKPPTKINYDDQIFLPGGRARCSRPLRVLTSTDLVHSLSGQWGVLNNDHDAIGRWSSSSLQFSSIMTISTISITISTTMTIMTISTCPFSALAPLEALDTLPWLARELRLQSRTSCWQRNLHQQRQQQNQHPKSGGGSIGPVADKEIDISTSRSRISIQNLVVVQSDQKFTSASASGSLVQ